MLLSGSVRDGSAVAISADDGGLTFNGVSGKREPFEVPKGKLH
jgi:hypothetical protein